MDLVRLCNDLSKHAASERACLLALDILHAGKQIRKDAWNQPGLQTMQQLIRIGHLTERTHLWKTWRHWLCSGNKCLHDETAWPSACVCWAMTGGGWSMSRAANADGVQMVIACR